MTKLETSISKEPALSNTLVVAASSDCEKKVDALMSTMRFGSTEQMNAYRQQALADCMKLANTSGVSLVKEPIELTGGVKGDPIMGSLPPDKVKAAAATAMMPTMIGGGGSNSETGEDVATTEEILEVKKPTNWGLWIMIAAGVGLILSSMKKKK